MKTIRLILLTTILMVITAQAAKPAERRTAEAVFRSTDVCTETVAALHLTQAQVIPSTQYPDGWLRDLLITVEHRDTCVGMQLLNAAGQLDATATQLAIDRRLTSAHVSAVVTVFDGIGQVQVTIAVTANWTGEGPAHRNVWRTIERDATATLAADGMGVQLRNYTTDAVLRTENTR